MTTIFMIKLMINFLWNSYRNAHINIHVGARIEVLFMYSIKHIPYICSIFFIFSIIN